jgi:hypothetical protein
MNIPITKPNTSIDMCTMNTTSINIYRQTHRANRTVIPIGIRPCGIVILITRICTIATHTDSGRGISRSRS